MNKTQQLLKEREDKWNELIDMYVAPNKRDTVKECVNGNAEYNGTVRINASAIPLFRNIKSFHATTISLLLNSLKEEIGKIEHPHEDVACDYSDHINKDDVLTLLSETISNIQTK